MIKAWYRCGYCGRIFTLTYFNSQDIPERNIGCTSCKTAGADVKLIDKIRDERSPLKEKTIPKTYTLRQLKKLGEKWLFVDLFLDSLENREREERKLKKLEDDHEKAVDKRNISYIKRG